MTATNPISGNSHRIGMGSFIDDIIRILPVLDGSLRQALAMDCIDVSILDAKLTKGGYAQNVSKQGALVHLSTSAATKKAEHELSGSCMTNIIHLGSYIHVDGYNAREVEGRIRACNIDWTPVTNCWTSSSVVKTR